MVSFIQHLTWGSTLITCLSTWVLGIKFVMVGRTSTSTFHGHLDKLDITILIIPGLVTEITAEVRTFVVVVWQKLTIVFAPCDNKDSVIIC